MNENPGAVTYRHEGTDRIYAFVRGTNDHLYVNFWNGVDQWLWAHQGPTASNAVAAHSPCAITSWQFHRIEEQHMHVFVAGSDGRLHEHLWNESNLHPLGAGWHWLDHGLPASNVSVPTGPGVTAYRRQSTGQLFDVFDQIDAFVAGSDGHLYRNMWNGRQEVWSWHDQGKTRSNTNVVGRPEPLAYYHQGTKRIYAFVRSSDNHLHVNFSRDTQLNSPWEWADQGTPKPTGTTVAGDPAAVNFRFEGTDRMYVFVRGSDGHLHVCFWNGVDQWVWADLGRPTNTMVEDRPAVLPYRHEGTDRMYVFVRGSDGHLHVCFWNGVDQWVWADLGRPESANTAVTSGPAAVNFRFEGTNRMYAFVWGSDGHLHVCFWDGRDTWAWRDQGAPPTAITITGIEQTQAIQFFRPALAPCPDRPSDTVCPENDITLVAEKEAILRAYVDVTQGTLPIVDSLSGVLETRPAGQVNWDHPPLPSINAPTAARRNTDIDRGDADHTLNFRIPANRCRDDLEIQLTVFDADHPGEAGYTSDSVRQTLRFWNFSPLKIRLVRIRYQNAARNLTVPAPTVSDFWATAEFSLRTYPIPGIDIVADSEELYDGDYTNLFDIGGAAGTTGPIFSIIDDLKQAEGRGDEVKYLALYHTPPVSQLGGVLGWGVAPNRAAVMIGMGPAMAQEIAHTCNRFHAPCGNPPGVDPFYPTYDNYPSGSIGEYGFDIVDSTVYDPSDAKDFMSYCNPAWVSPYTYEALEFGCFRPGSGSSSREAAGGAATRSASIQELLYLPITIHRTGRVVLKEPCFHLRGMLPASAGYETPYTVELRNVEGEVLESQRLRLGDVHRSPDEDPLHFFTAIPWHAESDEVVFRRDEDILHERKIGKTAPKVEITHPRGDVTLRGKQKVAWAASGRDSLTYILRYSHDGGESWQAIATRLTARECTVDLDDLPGGNRCLFQVLASEGIRTGVATSGPFVVPHKMRKLLVVAPHQGDVFTQGETVQLFGVISSPGGGWNMSEALSWTSSIDGYLGSGARLTVYTLRAGEHTITLRAGAAPDSVTPQSMTITVRPRESDTRPQ